MSDFDDLMNGLGIKKGEKGKKGSRSSATTVTDVAMLHRPEGEKEKALLHHPEEEKEKAMLHRPKKKKLKKEKKESFEDALKIYTSNARVKDDEIINDSKVNTNIFKDRFSRIEEEDIMYTIDLHNYTLNDAEDLVKKTIVWCYREKLDFVLIITGKGNHSSNGPILKIGIKNLLMTMSNLIEQIEYAPRYLGGEGAYILKIKL